jgi:hypothetical protein
MGILKLGGKAGINFSKADKPPMEQPMTITS